MIVKTLRDFTDKECYCWFPPFYLEDEIKKRRAIPEELLKSEAIKLVKVIKYQFPNVQEVANKRFSEWSQESLECAKRPDLIKEAEIKIAIKEVNEANAKIDIIKYFFNLTDEEIK